MLRSYSYATAAKLVHSDLVTFAHVRKRPADALWRRARREGGVGGHAAMRKRAVAEALACRCTRNTAAGGQENLKTCGVPTHAAKAGAPRHRLGRVAAPQHPVPTATAPQQFLTDVLVAQVGTGHREAAPRQVGGLVVGLEAVLAELLAAWPLQKRARGTGERQQGGGARGQVAPRVQRCSNGFC